MECSTINCKSTLFRAVLFPNMAEISIYDRDYSLPENPPPSIYFGGCAFGCAFYVGVVNAMRERWGPDFHRKMLISGGSAGTIFALTLALGKSPQFLDEVYASVAEKTMRYHPIYFGSVFLEEMLRRILSDPLSYKQLEGRCCFGTTEFFSKHRWHVSWENNEDLINTALASFNIPIYCKRVSPVKGVVVLDGAYGFAGTNLPHGDETLYIGIDPYAEITRSLTNHQMFYPALGDEYQAMVYSGYKAFQEWNGRMNRKVGFRRPNYEALFVLWLLKLVELIVYPLIKLMAMFGTLLIAILPLSNATDRP